MGKGKKGISRFMALPARLTAGAEKNAVPSHLYCWGVVPNSHILAKDKKNNEADSSADNAVEINPREISLDSKNEIVGDNIISFAASSEHIVAVTNKFKLVGCGKNDFGQLHPHSRDVAHVPYSELKLLNNALLDHQDKIKVLQVACGKNYTAYLTNIGRVYTFGGNEFGQLGHSLDRRSKYVGPSQVRIAHEICVSVACGDSSTYVLTKHGNVYSCGCGRNGRLGSVKLDSQVKYKFISELKGLPEMQSRTREFDSNQGEMKEVGGPLTGTPVVSISAGAAHCVAVTVTGLVYGWGINTHMQLGNFVPEDNKSGISAENDGICTPVKLNVENALDVSAGSNHTLVLTRSRKGVFVAGDNRNGQLGPLGRDRVDEFTEFPFTDIEESASSIVKVSAAVNQSSLLLDSGNVLFLGVPPPKESAGPVTLTRVDERVFRMSSEEAFDIGSAGEFNYILTSRKAIGDDGLIYGTMQRQIPLMTSLPIGISKNDVLECEVEKLFSKLRRVMFDMHTLNASFMKEKIETMGADSFCSSNVDVKGMIESMSRFCSLVKRESEELRVRQLISTLVGNMDQAAKNVTEPDQLRAYFILALSPLVEKFSPREHELIVVSVFNLPIPSRRLFFSWLYNDVISLDIDRVLTHLVKPMLKRLDQHITYRKYTQQAVKLCKFLNVVYMLCKHRESTSSIFDSVSVSSSAFYTTSLDGFGAIELEQMYKAWRAAVEKGGSDLNSVGRRVQDRPMGLLDQIFNMRGLQRMGSDFSVTAENTPHDSPDNLVLDYQGATYGLDALGVDFLIFTDNVRDSKLTDSAPEFVLFKYPFLLSANTKRQFMRAEDKFSQLRSAMQGFQQNAQHNFVLEVSRGENMLQETLIALDKLDDLPPYMLQRPLQVKFRDEDGLDAGGVKKEFFLLLSAELFSLKFNHFVTVGDTNTLWFNNAVSVVDDGPNVDRKRYLEAVNETVTLEERSTLKTIGIIIGLAVYNDTLLDVQFPPIMYQLLLNDLNEDALDLKSYRLFDNKGADHLEYILKITDPDELASLDLTFEITQELYEVVTDVELVTNGANIPVTMENREDYVKKIIQHHMYSPLIKIRSKILFEGFSRVIPQTGIAFRLFNSDELELLLCGTPELDFSLLKEKCAYEGGYNAEHKTIKRFWKIVATLNYEQRKKLLKFCTGSGRAPAGGLANMSFKIQRAGPDTTHLPTAYTCFNTLMLPDYISEEKMKNLLLLAIENSEGFGLQ